MADAPTSYTEFYTFKKWNDGYKPGAVGFNSNWDAIDAAIHAISSSLSGVSTDTDKWSGTSVGLDPATGRASLGLSNIANIGTGAVSTTEFNYLDGVTSSIQTQLNTINTTAGHTNRTYLDTINQNLATNSDVTFATITGTVQPRTGLTTYSGHGISAYNDAAIKSHTNTEDNWIYCDSANAQWGIYHRNIDSALTVTGNVDLPANSIAFIGNNLLTSYICLADGSSYFKGAVTLGTQATGTGHAVRADRTITINGTTNQVNVSATAQNLTADRTWTLSLPQDIHTGASPTFNKVTSTAATGTAPLTVTSTTLVSNLNADLWDGYQFSDYLNQAVKTTSSPILNNLTLSGTITSNGTGNNDFAGNINLGGFLTYNNGDAEMGIVANGSGRDLYFKTYSGSGVYERMRLTKDGRLGVGCTPSYNFQVQQTSATAAMMIGGGYYGNPRLYIYGLDNDAHAHMGFGTDMGGGPYELSIFSPNYSSMGKITFGTYDGTTYNQKMVMLNNGHFLIGTTTDTTGAILSINGDTKSYGDIYSDNYTGVDPYPGYYIGKNGSVFSKITANELHVKAFIADLEMALAGSQIISKSVAKIYSDFTVGGYLVVEEIEGFEGSDVFESGDYIRLRTQTRTAGSLTVVDIWGTVGASVTRTLIPGSNINGGTGKFTQSYAFTKLAGDGTTAKAGTLALDYGQSGNGIYETVAVGPLGKTPYSQIATFATNPWTDLKIRSRVGDLTGVPTTTYGALKTFGIYTQDFFGEGNTNIVGTLTAGDSAGPGATFYVGKIKKNLVIQPDINQWTKESFSGTVTNNAATAPDGTLTATNINGGTGVGYLYLRNSDGKMFAANSQVTYSVWLRTVSGTATHKIQIWNYNHSASRAYTDCNLTTEWKRFSVTYKFLADETDSNITIFDASTDNIYAWGAQVELGSVATPYQPVDGATPFGSGYGMWAINGGFGGTIQNPSVALDTAGIFVRNTGTTAGEAYGAGTYIGNYTAMEDFSGTILNHLGLYGYQGGYEVMKINNAGAKIASFTFDNEKFTNIANTFILSNSGVKFALGPSASSQTTSDSLVGSVIDGNGYFKTYMNSTNYIRANASGIDIKTGTFLLSSSNVSIGQTSGWFGANNILTYSASSVGLANWTVNNSSLYTSHMSISGGLYPCITVEGSDEFNFVSMFYSGGSYGIEAYKDGIHTFQLGSTNQIAGFTFDDLKLTKGTSSVGMAINTGSTAFLTATGKGFEVWDNSNPKLVAGIKNGSRMDWNFTSANRLTIVGDIDGSNITGSTLSGATVYTGTAANSYQGGASMYTHDNGDGTYNGHITLRSNNVSRGGGTYTTGLLDIGYLSESVIMNVQNYNNSTDVVDFLKIQWYGNNKLRLSSDGKGYLNEKSIMRFWGTLTTAPTSGMFHGDTYRLSSSGVLYVYDTSAWVICN